MSFAGKVDDSDIEVLKNLWMKIVIFIISIYVFLNWFYVIYFEKLSTEIIDADVFFPFLKFFKNLPGHYPFNFFMEIPLKVLDFLKDIMFYVLKTFPLEQGIGLEIIIPLFLLLIYRAYSNIDSNIFKYVQQVFNGQMLGSSQSKVVLLTTLAYIIAKLPFVYLPVALTSGPLWTIFYTTLWFFLKIFICIPISIFCFVAFYLYYSFFVILFQPIKDLGIWGTFYDIHEKFVNFNPIYSEVIHTANCVSGADMCKQQTFSSFMYNLIITPSLVFIIRHFFSFITILFLLITMITIFRSIHSSVLKTNLISFFGILSFLIVLICRWFKPTTIGFPVSADTNENKPIYMGFAPLLGCINIILIFLYYFNSKLLLTIPMLHSIILFIMIAAFVIQFVYVISLYPDIKLESFIYILSFFIAFSVMSFFGYNHFWKTAIGKLILASVFIVFILTLVHSR